jgi:hypothetical protein
MKELRVSRRRLPFSQRLDHRGPERLPDVNTVLITAATAALSTAAPAGGEQAGGSLSLLKQEERLREKPRSRQRAIMRTSSGWVYRYAGSRRSRDLSLPDVAQSIVDGTPPILIRPCHDSGAGR